MTSRAGPLAHFLCISFVLIALPVSGQAVRAPTPEQLQAELERRDAIIADLLQRVQALEQRLGTPAAPPQPPPAPAVAARSRSSADEAADEALLERALERSLVLSGGALLPQGQREIEPSLAYDYTQRSGLALLGDGVVSRNFRRENATAALALRAGLPWTSQVDVALPYTHQRIESSVSGFPAHSSESGMGDIQVALSKQFVNDREARFALLGSVIWTHSRDSATLRSLVAGLPDFASPAAVGAGYDAFIARLTASKRLDPLVFVGALSHAWNREESVDGVTVKPGASNGATFRAILAASPDVSLRAGMSFTRTDKTRLNGVSLEGTRTTASIIELGTSVVLNRNTLLDVSLGIGLTSESPDFLLGLSIPIRF